MKGNIVLDKSYKFALRTVKLYNVFIKTSFLPNYFQQNNISSSRIIHITNLIT